MIVDFNTITGKIKPMHAINNMPMIGAFASDDMFHYAGEAGIPYSRLHDTGGAFGGSRYVDIPNIFPNFDADENDPASYDFTFTDWLMRGMEKQNVKAFYRLGVTIENYQAMKAYHIYPPKDFAKWARICEKIIAHYNEGWADGFRLGIEYWEIWNEPDNYPDIEDNQCWKGTFEEYMEFYKVVSLHLKKAYPDLKIGGYGSCGFYNLFKGHIAWIANSSDRTEYFIECFHKFLKFAKENNLPLDFFSWHSYSDDAEKNIVFENYARKNLDEYGFTNTESILNEWNPGIDKRGTLEDGARISDIFLKMQDSTVDMLMYYDGQVYGGYQGLYNPLTYTPFKAYYAFKAFSVLYKLGNQAEVTGVKEGLSAVAAVNEEGKKAFMVTNKGDKTHFVLETDAENTFEVYRLNETKDLELSEKYSNNQTVEIDKFETLLFIRE